MIRRIRRRLLLLLALAGVVPDASGMTCSVSADSVSFGTYDTFSLSPTDATGNVQVTCEDPLAISASYSIALSTGGSGTYAPRRMSSGSDTVDYNLYSDSARTTTWGDGSGFTQTVDDGYVLAQTSETRNYTVYGRIPASQNVTVGSYDDTITVTVTY